MYPTDPCPGAAPAGRPRAAAAPGKSRLCAFLSRGVGVGDGDGEGDSRSADLRGDEAAETDPAPGLAFDLDLSLLRGHHAGIAPLAVAPTRGASARLPGTVPPPSSNCRGEMEGEEGWGRREGEGEGEGEARRARKARGKEQKPTAPRFR